MWPFTGIVFAFAVILLLELPGLRKGKQYKPMMVFILWMIAGFTLYTLEIMHVELPNPLAAIERLYEWLGLTLEK